MKSWIITFLSCAALAMTPMLTGCSSASKTWPEFEIASQPSYLYLPAGTQVQTRDGIYQVRQNEKWVNPRAVRLYQLMLKNKLDAKEEAELKELMR
jgi:hypothetical protein